MSKRIKLGKSKTKHGSHSGYARGCRCKACTKAHSKYQYNYFKAKNQKSTFKWVFAFNDLNTALALSLFENNY